MLWEEKTILKVPFWGEMSQTVYHLLPRDPGNVSQHWFPVGMVYQPHLKSWKIPRRLHVAWWVRISGTHGKRMFERIKGILERMHMWVCVHGRHLLKPLKGYLKDSWETEFPGARHQYLSCVYWSLIWSSRAEGAVSIWVTLVNLSLSTLCTMRCYCLLNDYGVAVSQEIEQYESTLKSSPAVTAEVT